MMFLHVVIVSVLSWRIALGIVSSTDTMPLVLVNPHPQETQHNPWIQGPTWRAEIDISEHAFRNRLLEVSLQNVEDLARMHWNWLKIKQPPGWQVGGKSLVAVMFVPGVNILWASTVPHGPRHAFMFENSHDAPAWWAATRSASGKIPQFHAEDGVFFNYETSTWAAVVNNKYPRHSIIAVWGSFTSNKIDGEDRALRDREMGQRIDLCSTSTANKIGQPKCREVAASLGLWNGEPNFAANTEGNQIPQEQDPAYNVGALGKSFLDASNAECESLDMEWQASHKRFSIREAKNVVAQRNQDGSLTISACSITFSTSVTISTVTSLPVSFGEPPPATTSTKAIPTSNTASMTCDYQDATPEDGNEAACTCIRGSSTTIVKPMTLSSVSVITQSCAYTTWPSTAGTVTAPAQMTSTNLASCQVCTVHVLGPVDAECSLLPPSLGCTAQTTSTILSMNTQGVTVGTLSGSALFSAVTSGIDFLCQVPANNGAATGSFTCTETATATIASDVRYTSINAGQKDWSVGAKVIMQITEANYDSLEWYSTNKNIIAAYVQNSTQNNCQTIAAYSEPDITRREIDPHYQPLVESNFTICQVGSNYQLIEIDPGSTGPARELSISLRFQESTNGFIFCQFLEDLVEFIEIAVNLASDTEEAVPAELKVDEGLLRACEDIASAVAIVQSVTSDAGSVASAVASAVSAIF